MRTTTKATIPVSRSEPHSRAPSTSSPAAAANAEASTTARVARSTAVEATGSGCGGRCVGSNPDDQKGEKEPCDAAAEQVADPALHDGAVRQRCGRLDCQLDRR